MQSATRSSAAAIVFVVLIAAVAPARAQIYVSNYDTGTIGAYNLDGTPINTALITGLVEPQGIAVSNGNIYVVSADSFYTSKIGKYTTSGAIVNDTLLGGLSPQLHGIAVSGSDLYASHDFGWVSKYTTSGAVIDETFVTFTTVFPDPLGLAISGTDLYVTNELGNKVGHFTTSGATIDDAMIDTGPSTSPFALAISGSTIFVSNNGGEISAYTTSGDLIQFGLIPSVASSTGIGVLGDRIFVGSAVNDTVGCYNLDGTPVNEAFISGLHHPNGIAVIPEPTSIAALPMVALASASLRRRRTGKRGSER